MGQAGKRKHIDLGDGYMAEIDLMHRKGGRIGGHVHVTKGGVEVAKVSDTGAYMVAHKGQKLLKPSELPKPIRNRVGRIARKLGKGTIIGIGIGIFFFANDCEAHGADGAAARQVPVAGDILTVTDIVKEEEDDALANLNTSSRRAHERAKETLLKWLDYELSRERPILNPDEEEIIKAIQTFYNELVAKYLLEESTGLAANINGPAQQFQNDLNNALWHFLNKPGQDGGLGVSGTSGWGLGGGSGLGGLGGAL